MQQVTLQELQWRTKQQFSRILQRSETSHNVKTRGYLAYMYFVTIMTIM
jgi:hypothetical protein